ncbi:type II toxin-antitoxin system VapC family toxin [Humibacter ginsengiterrae]
MTVVVDTSVLIDVLRGDREAVRVLRESREAGVLHSSEIVKLEVLAGMRPSEEAATRRLLGAVTWHALDEEVAEIAGELGRKWLPRNRGIDSADLAIAATTIALDAQLLTRNVKHFPMFADLSTPY